MDDSASDIEWLSRSAGAYARSPEIILNLHEFFSMDGVSCYSPRTMGGNEDLHTFHSVNLMHDMIGEVCDRLFQWFGVIKPWEPDLIAKERFFWLRMEGVPLHAWNSELSYMVNG